MSEQLIFDLPVRTAQGRDDFMVSGANASAVQAIENWENWPLGKLLLIGPSGSGKTHLSHVWAENAGAQVVAALDLSTEMVAELVGKNQNIALEGIDQIANNPDAENAVFHLHNLALAEGGRLLMTTNGEPAQNPMSLPDLQSRLAGTATAVLAPPDDALLSAVMVKLFADRQLDIPLNVIEYLVPRIERNFASLAAVVREIDRSALAQNRAVTRDLARQVMDKLSQPLP